MQQVVVLTEQAFPAKLMLNPELAMNDDKYFDFCMANPDVRFERNEQGEIIIAPPAGPESDYRNVDVTSQLVSWSKRGGRGTAFGPTTEFFLPTDAALSPDAAWISNVRLSQFSKEQRRKFLHVAPEFIVEVMSVSDRLPAALEKMQTWIRGGVELAWLIDGDSKTVHIYRKDREPEARSSMTTQAADGPVEGFELDLTDIWAGL